jgi:CheY-like chemotaxis protein
VAGDYAMLAVTDTGEGIPADKIGRVFEPFFTTKEVGKGSGLGLSMIHGFTKQSNGHIQIYSEVGRGTTVKMYLPRVQGEGDKAVVKSAASMPKGVERILVVEDNAPVLANVVEQLRSLGYSVTEAVNGAAALAHLEATTETYDLLLTDMVMPGTLDGKALADQVMLRWPDMSVIFMSGYTGNAILQQGQLPPGMRLLTKPFRKVDLANAVRSVFAGAAAKPPIAA